MSDDKIGNKTGPEGLSETDKGYYEDLYNLSLIHISEPTRRS